jgi:hypothetical protein
MNEISEKILDHLISIGNRGKLLDYDRNFLSKKSWINSIHFNDWHPITERLSQTDLEGLIRGIIISEREFEWPGGSVASVIWVFDDYARRFRASANALGDWALQNCISNSYAERRFRHDYSRFETAEEEYRHDLRQWHDALMVSQERKRQQKILKAEKRAQRLALRLSQGQLRAAQVKRLNVSLAALPPLDRLKKIAALDTPLESISGKNLNDCIQEVGNLDTKTTLILIEKLDRRNRGAWGKINRELKKKPGLSAQLDSNNL